MTIGEYIKQFPVKVFSIEYYFEEYCSECHHNFLVMDHEYSFDCSASDIGSTGYDWIFDIPVGSYGVEIMDNLIKIVVESGDPFLCDSCANNW